MIVNVIVREAGVNILSVGGCEISVNRIKLYPAHHHGLALSHTLQVPSVSQTRLSSDRDT